VQCSVFSHFYVPTAYLDCYMHEKNIRFSCGVFDVFYSIRTRCTSFGSHNNYNNSILTVSTFTVSLPGLNDTLLCAFALL
jgi:hypothetical protein